MGSRIRVDRRLYMTEDRSRLVPEGDPDARWLWAPAGAEVDRAEAERLGALTPLEVAPVAASEPDGDEEEPQQEQPKRRTPRANKARTPGGNKRAGEG